MTTTSHAMMSTMLVIAGMLAETGSARAQDTAAGERTFAQCKACHQVGESAKNSSGPVLNGIVGRKAGTYPGYNYSEAMKTSGLVWEETTLREFLLNPKSKVVGTKMTLAGVKDDKVPDLIAYLKTYGTDGGSPK